MTPNVIYDNYLRPMDLGTKKRYFRHCRFKGGQMAQQGQAAFQQAMAAKNNLAAQRDAAMQSTQAQAQQAQAQEEQKKQQLLGLVSMATGGFGLGKALGKAAGAVAGKAGGAAAGAATSSMPIFNTSGVFFPMV